MKTSPLDGLLDASFNMILRAGRRSLQEPNDVAALEQHIPDATRN